MNTRQNIDIMTELQKQEEAALDYLQKTDISDLIISLDSLSNAELDRIENACSALLQDRLRVLKHSDR